eukprot:2028029-Prymnesium_polylepis.1
MTNCGGAGGDGIPGGGPGGPGGITYDSAIRSPQSLQSEPSVQNEVNDCGPPSSHSPSCA